MAVTSLVTSGKVASSRTKFGGMICFLGAGYCVFQRADRAGESITGLGLENVGVPRLQL
jgi:hypothetical protein